MRHRPYFSRRSRAMKSRKVYPSGSIMSDMSFFTYRALSG